jgi:PEP-CTERM motif-containing protein
MLVRDKFYAWAMSGCVAVGLTVFCGSARAEVLFDSLNSPNTGIMGEAIGFTYPADASFETGASTVHATDIALLLSQINGFAPPGDTFTVSLVGGVPLAELMFDPILGLNVTPGPEPALGSVTLPISDLSTDLAAENFNQFASIPLKANSFYWIDLSLSQQATVDGASVGWGTTDDNSGLGVAAGYNSSDASDFAFFPNNRDDGEEAFQMEVGTPEPSTWALMLVGLAGLGVLARSRRSTVAVRRA